MNIIYVKKKNNNNKTMKKKDKIENLHLEAREHTFFELSSYLIY